MTNSCRYAKAHTELARQTDGLNPLKVIGETHLVLSRGGTNLHLDALVVEDLDVEILAGTPSLVSNDISIRPPNIRSQLVKPLYTTVTIATAPSVTRFVEHRHVFRGPASSMRLHSVVDTICAL